MNVKLISAMTLACIFFIGCKKTAQPDAKTDMLVTVTGRISNVKDVEQYLTKETYLQIYPEEFKGPTKVQFEVDEMGRLVAKSDLAVVPFPRNGRFTFKKVAGLKSDRTYTIAVKMLKRPYPGMIPLVKENAESFNFTLPTEDNAPQPSKQNIDFAENKLVIPLPLER